MPRYFFTLRDDGQDVSDADGLELTDIQEARRHARMMANELSRNSDGTKEICIIVTDDGGNPVASISGVG